MGVLPLRKESRDLQDAVERALSEGPLTITRDGVPAAVLLSAEEYRRMAGEARPTLAELILRRPPDAAIDLEPFIGPRRGEWRRDPPDFE